MKRILLWSILGLLLTAACASTPERRSLGEGVDDSVLLAKIKSKLLLHDEMKGIRVNVDVKKGIVSVTGRVHSEAQKVRLLEIVQAMKGVKTVHSELAVREKSGYANKTKKIKETDTKTKQGELIERDLGHSGPKVDQAPQEKAVQALEEEHQDFLSEDVDDDQLEESVKKDDAYWTNEAKREGQ